ncbi:MAG: hypothetical protein EYC68_02840 [Chloroflexota bacterium]|nr:MAG: hypothetical protein EYC68_02840 [Chloroflexota bacterium]
MAIIPIQITEEGVLIPRTYFPAASQLEVVMRDDYVLLKPKSNAKSKPKKRRKKSSRYSFIGIGHSRNPNASVEAEEILEREVDRVRGWTVDR